MRPLQTPPLIYPQPHHEVNQSTGACVADPPSAQVFEIQQVFLETVFSCTTGSNGAVLFFVGDEVVVTWNAASPCADFANRAAAAALNICRALTAAPELTAVRQGICMALDAGQGLCGNVGTAKQRHFSVMGVAWEMGLMLRHICLFFKHPLLMGPGIIARLAPSFVYAHVDYVVPQSLSPGPSSLVPPHPVLISKLIGAHPAPADLHWMYTSGSDAPEAAESVAWRQAYNQSWHQLTLHPALDAAVPVEAGVDLDDIERLRVAVQTKRKLGLYYRTIKVGPAQDAGPNT